MLVGISHSGKPGKMNGEGQGGIRSFEVNRDTRNAVCAAASICLKKYNQELSACHYRNGLFLLHGGVKALALDRCSHLGLSISHASCIRMQTKIGKGFNAKALNCKEDSEERELTIRFLKEIKSKQKDYSQEMNPEYGEYNISKQAVHLYSYNDEQIHEKCTSLFCQENEGTISSGMSDAEQKITLKELEDAINKTRNEITNFKYVCTHCQLYI
jgi:hypothetical protein